MLPFLSYTPVDESKESGSAIIDSLIIDKYLDLAFDSAFTNPDSAFYFVNFAIESAEQINYLKGKYDAIQMKGIIFYAIDHYDSALNYFFDALEYRQAQNDLEGIASSINNIALCYTNLSIYESAVKYNLEGLKIREEIDDSVGIAKSLNNLGICYHNLKNYKKAIKYYKEALKMKFALKDEYSIASTYNNIGQLFFDWGYESEQYFDSASSYLIKAVKLREKINDQQGLSESLLNLGNVYIQKGEYYRALIFIENSLQKFTQNGDKYGQANAYFNRGYILYSKVDAEMNKALDQFKKSIEIAEEINSLELLRDNYLNIANLYKRTNKYDQAYEYMEMYNEIKDSIISVETSKEIAKLQIQYETQKKDKLILQQESNIDKLTARQNIYTVILIILSAIVIIVIIYIIYLILNKRFKTLKGNSSTV